MKRARLSIDTVGRQTYITELPLVKARSASDHFARACGLADLVGTITFEPEDGSPHVTIPMRHITGLTYQELPE